MSQTPNTESTPLIHPSPPSPHPHHKINTSYSSDASSASSLSAPLPQTPTHPSFLKSTKFGFLTIICSTLILGILILLVLAVLTVTIYEHFQSRHDHVNLNIHLKLSMQCESEAIRINKAIQALDKEQQIDLDTRQQPHITLYLTDFQERSYAVFSKLVEQLVQDEFLTRYNSKGERIPDSADPCTVQCLASQMRNVSTYAMWPVQNSQCIQQMSNRIVEKISAYTTDESKKYIPEWIYTLPEALKEEKIRMIRKYGSPNVFSQFDPHVTLAYDDSMQRLQAAFTEAGEDLVPDCEYVVEEIAFGEVGPWGTVLRGKDRANFRLTQIIEDE